MDRTTAHMEDMMIRTSYIIKLGAVAITLALFDGGVASSGAQAQVLDRAVQGAIGGAVIGGVARGKKGIGPGAAIGAAAGAVVGAVEEDRRRKARARRAYRSSDGRTRRASRNDPLVYDTQAVLTDLGYEPGPVDGSYGPRTSQAITEYQKENGLLVTGTPSEALLAHMNKQGG